MAELSTDFKIAPPGPLSYESDEESFVVLGKSLVSDMYDTPTESHDLSADKTIQDAKAIIDEEIRKLSMSANTKDNFVQKSEAGLLQSKNPFENMNNSQCKNDFLQSKSLEKNMTIASQLEGAIKDLSIEEKPTTSKVFTMSDSSFSSYPSKELNYKLTFPEEHLRSIPKELRRSPERRDDVTSMSQEDLHKMIAEIVEENTQLRKSLEQNNIKMREQCKRIAEWQNEVKHVHEAHKEKILEAKEHIDTLTSERNLAKSEVSTLQEELNMTRTKLAEIQIVQTEVQQSRSAAYATISALNAEVKRLLEQIEELEQREKKDEEIFVLQTQLELYKKDFEEERKAKDMMREEKEKMSEDLQNLQRRNQQLQERIEMVCDKDYLMYEGRPDRQRVPQSSSSSSQALMKCPKCSNGFADITSLQNHCNLCIT